MSKDDARELNIGEMIFHLNEAKDDISSLIDELNRGEYSEDDDDAAMEVSYDHILYHLCLSWHFRWLTDEEVDRVQEDQAAYEACAHSVPDWFYHDRVIVPSREDATGVFGD